MGQFLNDSEVDRSRDKDFRFIHVHMVDEAVDTNEVGKGEKYRNKGKGNEGQNFEKLHVREEFKIKHPRKIKLETKAEGKHSLIR